MSTATAPSRDDARKQQLSVVQAIDADIATLRVAASAIGQVMNIRKSLQRRPRTRCWRTRA